MEVVSIIEDVQAPIGQRRGFSEPAGLPDQARNKVR